MTITSAMTKHIIQDSLNVSLNEKFFLDFLENLIWKYETSS